MFTKQLELWGLSLIEIGMGINVKSSWKHDIYKITTEEIGSRTKENRQE